MSDELLRGLCKALFATIVIEETVACFFKERSWRFALVALLMNVATNPTINLVVRSVPDSLFQNANEYAALVFILEFWVWLIEACFLRAFLRDCAWSRALLLSLVLNLASFLSGYPLDYLGYWDW